MTIPMCEYNFPVQILIQSYYIIYSYNFIIIIIIIKFLFSLSFRLYFIFIIYIFISCFHSYFTNCFYQIYPWVYWLKTFEMKSLLLFLLNVKFYLEVNFNFYYFLKYRRKSLFPCFLLYGFIFFSKCKIYLF
jgi:hypothetical protein